MQIWGSGKKDTLKKKYGIYVRLIEIPILGKRKKNEILRSHDQLEDIDRKLIENKIEYKYLQM